MTEVERAINYLTSLQFQFENYLHTVAHLDVAITALREKAEREKGCVFCNDERHSIREVFDEGTAKIIDAENHYALSVDTSRDAAIFNIFCCPMCGKRLEV
jgi:hypothetical protein